MPSHIRAQKQNNFGKKVSIKQEGTIKMILVA